MTDLKGKTEMNAKTIFEMKILLFEWLRLKLLKTDRKAHDSEYFV